MESFSESYCYDDDEQQQLPVAPKLVFDPLSLLFLPLLCVLCVFLLGFLKATLGLCIQPIGKWGYNYMQPVYTFERASKCRQFGMNLIFFFIVPCLFCCVTRCCKWRDVEPGTENILVEKGRLKERTILKQEVYEIPSFEGDSDYSPSESNFDPHEKTALLNGTDAKENERRTSAGYFDYKSIDTDDALEQEDTRFVLSTLSQSRESSMRCLDGLPHINNTSNDDDNFPPEVNTHIKTLLETQMVYRVFTHPIGNISVAPTQKYSIRGFFIPSLANKFKFITNLPLRQHWKIANDGNLVPLFPPNVLLSRDFTRLYENKQDVFDANDLLIKPSMNAPVLNMQLQAKYVYETTTEDDEKKTNN